MNIYYKRFGYNDSRFLGYLQLECNFNLAPRDEEKPIGRKRPGDLFKMVYSVMKVWMTGQMIQ